MEEIKGDWEDKSTGKDQRIIEIGRKVLHVSYARSGFAPSLSDEGIHKRVLGFLRSGRVLKPSNASMTPLISSPFGITFNAKESRTY
jgi:hypothetical protein